MNPESIINRGYAKIVINDNIVMSVNQINVNDDLNIVVKDGVVVGQVKEVKKKWLLKRKIID